MRKTFQDETPETSDSVLCDYCGGTLHAPEWDVFWDQTADHTCEPMLEARIESLQTTVMDLATDLSKVTMKLQRATRGLEFIACEDNAEGHHAKRVLADIEKIKENDNA